MDREIIDSLLRFVFHPIHVGAGVALVAGVLLAFWSVGRLTKSPLTNRAFDSGNLIVIEGAPTEEELAASEAFIPDEEESDRAAVMDPELAAYLRGFLSEVFREYEDAKPCIIKRIRTEMQSQQMQEVERIFREGLSRPIVRLQAETASGERILAGDKLIFFVAALRTGNSLLRTAEALEKSTGARVVAVVCLVDWGVRKNPQFAARFHVKHVLTAGSLKWLVSAAQSITEEPSFFPPVTGGQRTG